MTTTTTPSLCCCCPTAVTEERPQACSTSTTPATPSSATLRTTTSPQPTAWPWPTKTTPSPKHAHAPPRTSPREPTPKRWHGPPPSLPLPAPTAARKHTLTIASRLLIDYWHPDTDETLADSLATHGITPALMRRRAASFLTALPPVDTTPSRDWRRAARAVLKAQLPFSGHTVEAPKILSLATKERDMPIASLVGMPPDEDPHAPAAAMRSSTIHQAKGSEADAVLIHLPRPQSVTELLQAWADPFTHTDNDELLRTYYVAVTRARRLVALTYPMPKHDDVLLHLDSLKIEYRTQTVHPAL